MSQNIRSLWSPEIKAKVLTPLTILKGQAEALALQTGGVLLAEVTSETLEEGQTSVSFDLVAPALHGSRHRIMKVTHDENLPYPVWVEAEVFSRLNIRSRRRANTDHDFTETVAEVLKSPGVLSIAQSLLARANEALTNKQNGSTQ
jgi:hypothetical protein